MEDKEIGRNCQEQPRYNPYFHSGKVLQCSAIQSYRTRKRENSLEESKWFLEKPTSQIMNIRRILGVRPKNLEATLWFVHFSLAFDFIHRGKMEQIFLATMMLYKNTKVKVRSPDGDTDFFGIVAGVLQRVTLASYLFIICQDDFLRTSIDLMKGNGFKKQTIPRTSYYRRGLRRWHSATGKYTRPRWIPGA